MTEHERHEAGHAPEPLSPELALVDPELARRARARLGADGDSVTATPVRPDADAPAERDDGAGNARTWAQPSIRERLLAAGADPERLLPSEDVHAEPASAPGDPDRPRRRRSWVLIVAAMTIAAIAGAVAGFVLVGAGSGDGEEAEPLAAAEPTQTAAGPPPPPDDRGSAPTSPQESPPPRRTTSPAPAAAKPRRPTPAPTATRTFVWPPASRATFYRVEFFTRGRKVFQASPTKPRLTLPLRWRYRGRSFRLVRGTYQWRVRAGFGRSPARLGAFITRSTWTVR